MQVLKPIGELYLFFVYPFQKNYDDCKMQFMNNGFNNIQSEWFNLCTNVNSWKEAKKSLTYSSINVRH